MQFPSFKEHMIAAAVWYHLERGVDISEIAQFLYPEYEHPDMLYSIQPKELVDTTIKKAIRMTVVPVSGDPSQPSVFPKVSLQKACGAFFDKDDPRKESHVYFKDRRIQMEPPTPPTLYIRPCFLSRRTPSETCSASRVSAPISAGLTQKRASRSPSKISSARQD